MMGMDVDPHDKGLGGKVLQTNAPTQRNSRDGVRDLHAAIDLASEFEQKIKALHPWAAVHIKHLIMQGAFL